MARDSEAVFRIYGENTILTTDREAAEAAEELGHPVNELRHKESTLPSQLGATVTMNIPLFTCDYCDSKDTVSREDGEWVCLRCGMPVTDHIAGIANEQLENGEFERGRIKHEAKALGQVAAAQLEAANRGEDGE